MSNANILVVDDEEDIIELIRFQLESDGYSVRSATNGIDATKAILNKKPSLVILDIMMPKMNGLELVSFVRSKKELSSMPLIIVSAKTEEDDIVKGLDLGADDYITKPFSLKILSSKVKATLRRNYANDKISLLKIDDLLLDKDRFFCSLDGDKIDLTATEFNLLYTLCALQGRVFTRNQLINNSKGSDYPVTERSIDVQIAAIRKKLGDFGKKSIQTIWGIGYKFEYEV